MKKKTGQMAYLLKVHMLKRLWGIISEIRIDLKRLRFIYYTALTQSSEY